MNMIPAFYFGAVLYYAVSFRRLETNPVNNVLFVIFTAVMGAWLYKSFKES